MDGCPNPRSGFTARLRIYSEASDLGLAPRFRRRTSDRGRS
nr:MAG TPA: hypothetical protein [Caudoviricetes sp.]